MRKERYRYMQIGKTCGFYSIGCCLDELYGLDDPLGFISIMVENCKYSGLTVVGEVFDIDLLLNIAKTFIPRDIKVSKIKLNAAEDILNILSENTRVILPVQSGKTPHYVVLQSHNGRIVTCCNGGMVEKHSYKKLFRLHKNVKNKYDWKKFEVCSKFDFYINCKRYKLSEQEIQMWSRDWKDNRERLKMLRKRGKQEVKMKGYCLLFYR